MAHEIMDQRALFVGTPAWHGRGVLVQDAPSTAEAVRMAGMDWPVDRLPVFDENGERVDGWNRIVVGVTGETVAILTDRFVPLQNENAFSWFDPIIEAGDASIESAGVLRNGRRVWILARLHGADTEVVEGDKLSNYLLLAHGHDGSLAISLDLTSIRVVCANTLRAAIGEDGSRAAFRLKHTTNTKAKLDEIRQSMDFARQVFRQDAEFYRKLAQTECSTASLKRIIARTLKLEQKQKQEAKKAREEAEGRALVAELLGISKTPKETSFQDLSTKTQNQIEYIERSFESGPGANLAGKTLWGAYNAVSDFVTHTRGHNDDSRLNAGWFGEGKSMLDRCIEATRAEL